jgi:hypothetical protein
VSGEKRSLVLAATCGPAAQLADALEPTNPAEQLGSFRAMLMAAVALAALEVLGTVGDFWVTGEGAVAWPAASPPIRAVLSFNGGISGHLLVTSSGEDAKLLYQLFVPGNWPADVDLLDDLVRELCNQILGRINSFFVMRGVPVRHGLPILLQPSAPAAPAAADPTTLLTLALTNGRARVGLQYDIAEFDPSRLQAPVMGRVIELGSVHYL